MPKRLHLSLKEMIERTELPWERLKIEREGGVILYFQYPLTPKFFLATAKEDSKCGARGLVNALSNAKRAIDCQTDSFLSAIGYSPKDLNKQLGKSGIEELRTFSVNIEQPLKFRVLESLGIVTPAIVARVRTIRNLLEHQYKKPPLAAVKDAIDVAALYVSACEGAMKAFLDSVYLLGSTEIKHPVSGEKVSERSLWILLENYEQIHLEIHYREITKHLRAEVKLLPDDPHYLAFLRILFAVRLEENIERSIAFAASSAGVCMADRILKVKSVDWA